MTLLFPTWVTHVVATHTHTHTRTHTHTCATPHTMGRKGKGYRHAKPPPLPPPLHPSHPRLSMGQACAAEAIDQVRCAPAQPPRAWVCAMMMMMTMMMMCVCVCVCVCVCLPPGPQALEPPMAEGAGLCAGQAPSGCHRRQRGHDPQGPQQPTCARSQHVAAAAGSPVPFAFVSSSIQRPKPISTTLKPAPPKANSCAHPSPFSLHT